MVCTTSAKMFAGFISKPHQHFDDDFRVIRLFKLSTRRDYNEEKMFLGRRHRILISLNVVRHEERRQNWLACAIQIFA